VLERAGELGKQMATDYQRAKRKRNGLANWRLVRYADDFVVVVSGERHHAEALREEVSVVLAPLGLRLAPDKTRVAHIDEGLDFLGVHIRRMRKRGAPTVGLVRRASPSRSRRRLRTTDRLRHNASATRSATTSPRWARGSTIRGTPLRAR